MRAVTMITITSLVLFFIEDVSCIIKVSHKKPIKIKIQAKPSLLVKPLPFFLLKKHHGKKIRLGWPLSALFTFKAVKYAKLAFLSSLVKKRRRRSTDSTSIMFSAPSSRIWLSNHKIPPNSTASRRTSYQPFHLDLRLLSTNTNSSSTETPVGPPYHIVTDTASEKSRVIDSSMNSASNRSLDDFGKVPSASFLATDDKSANDPTRAIIYFSSGEEDRDFMRAILDIPLHGSNSTESSIPSDQPEQPTEASDANFLGLHTEATTLQHFAPSTEPLAQIIPTLAPSISGSRTSVSSSRDAEEVIKLEMGLVDTTTFYPDGISTKLTEVIERNSSLTDSSTNMDSLPESSTSPPHDSDDTEFDPLPEISVVTSVSELLTTMTTTAAVSEATSTATTPTQPDFPTELPFREAKPPSANVESFRRAALRRKVPHEEKESGLSHALHGFRNSTKPLLLVDRIVTVAAPDHHSDKIDENRTDFTDDEIPLIIRSKIESQTDVGIPAETEQSTALNGSTSEDYSATEVPTSTRFPSENSTMSSDNLVPSTTAAAAKTPSHRPKPVFLDADVILVLNEINRELNVSSKTGKSSKPGSRKISQLSDKRRKKPKKSRTTTTTVSTNSEESTEGREIEDANEENNDERALRDAKAESENNENVEGLSRETEDDPAPIRSGTSRSKKSGKRTPPVKKTPNAQTGTATSVEDEEDEEIAEVFRSLRANDHNGCIQRAICEYEAIKRTTKLTPMQESFVDLFGKNVKPPDETDQRKDSFPFHKAAFIGNSLRDTSICARTFKSCSKTPDSMLPAFEQSQPPNRPGNTIEVPGPVTGDGPPNVPQNRPAFQSPIYPQNPFGLPGGVPVPIPPNVNVRPGSKATQFPDGTLLILEAPEDPAPGLPVIPHPKPLDSPNVPEFKPHTALNQAPPGATAFAPAVFETEVTFSAGGKAFNEALPKIPKILDQGIKLTPQMIDLVSGLLKKDNHRGKGTDVIHTLVKDIVIGHIQKQITTVQKPPPPSSHPPALPHPPAPAPAPSPPSPPLPPKKTPTFPVVPPAIPKTTPQPAVLPTPPAIPIPPPCQNPCCYNPCPPTVIKHIHNHFDKTTTTTTTTRKPRTTKKAIVITKHVPFLVIEKEPFRLEIGKRR